MAKDQIDYRIGDTEKKIMLVLAFIIDGIGIVPAYGDAANAAGFPIFYIWFKIHKVDFVKMQKKKPGRLLMKVFGETVVEWFLIYFPGLTWSVHTAIKESRKEDIKNGGAKKIERNNEQQKEKRLPFSTREKSLSQNKTQDKSKSFRPSFALRNVARPKDNSSSTQTNRFSPSLQSGGKHGIIPHTLRSNSLQNPTSKSSRVIKPLSDKFSATSSSRNINSLKSKGSEASRKSATPKLPIQTLRGSKPNLSGISDSITKNRPSFKERDDSIPLQDANKDNKPDKVSSFTANSIKKNNETSPNAPTPTTNHNRMKASDPSHRPSTPISSAPDPSRYKTEKGRSETQATKPVDTKTPYDVDQERRKGESKRQRDQINAEYQLKINQQTQRSQQLARELALMKNERAQTFERLSENEKYQFDVRLSSLVVREEKGRENLRMLSIHQRNDIQDFNQKHGLEN